ncbi:low molecular weight protein arginine phosphatase [Paenibacillus filicis]|uniref:Low molecular weight protein arginine phosphatase n=1 Tax=Paenibacillus gyeongsangnamensis TaxID=3388067 RepID=A0ABT4QDM8_9BACL|nr:low molecular weight protein arginine phosphatase [Paenibacillus filicis]MCZ8514810.1 low molecular weight protein arginine phosphatase [Paenibacillus filicis]
MKKILFVCTGNTCRSPMAEGMLRSMLAEQAFGLMEVKSAGVAAYDGSPVSDHAVTVLKNKGCSVTGGSTPLTSSIVAWADLILTMTSSHKRHTIQLYPESVDKVFTLKEFVHDDTDASKREELQGLLTELQLKRALSQPITEEERTRLLTLEKELPGLDISDPFGGSLRQYQACAEEIETCLKKLLAKWKD